MSNNILLPSLRNISYDKTHLNSESAEKRVKKRYVILELYRVITSYRKYLRYNKSFNYILQIIKIQKKFNKTFPRQLCYFY